MTGRLGERTWVELDGPAPRTVLVPVGSLEQHGPHLPLDTDARIASAVARRAAEGDPSVLLAPPLAYGASGEHEGFPGTLSIGHDALRAVLVELGRSAAAWASRLVFVNGHGGNLPTVPAAVGTLRHEGRDVAWFGCGVPGGDAHAGHTETSILLELDPSVVRTGAAQPGNTAPLRELLPALRRGGVTAVSRNGVLGDPTGASAVQGRSLLDEMAAALRAGLAGWEPDENGRL
ncbi:mycofactocin biosynthesis peptidyl-dipeptidase MftE [Pseudonocardia humida]|uniref:Mycofactocin biosynthesis peptidyl-dipeptidase MftE n=1 Tax=Pseudonocardia humida TaxID=2800819 RepID=A0ABT1A1N1_9PSEU|nr:mycofactocin biosynthesis peptidyl-dipeptidase MftE [Pseudonocardia humida]MCO1656838.1 mycofactocin biosynthesis peptidyl-dipeptidase MftE [Pseudonocardia humida]